MTRDPLLVLARLERQTLDRHRGTLVAAQGRQERLRAVASRRQADWREAVELAATADARLDLWGGLSRGTRQVLDRAEAERHGQLEELAAARAAVAASLVELKRLEVLAARRQARGAAAAALREQRLLDDLAVLRHAHRQS